MLVSCECVGMGEVLILVRPRGRLDVGTGMVMVCRPGSRTADLDRHSITHVRGQNLPVNQCSPPGSTCQICALTE